MYYPHYTFCWDDIQMKKMRPKPLLSTHLFSDFQTMWDVISSSLHFPWVSFWRENVPSVLTHFLQEKDHDTIMQSWIILKRDTYSKENVSNPNFLLFDPPQPQGPMYLLLTLGKWGSKWGDFHWAMGPHYKLHYRTQGCVIRENNITDPIMNLIKGPQKRPFSSITDQF